jgi:hypothetical protein
MADTNPKWIDNLSSDEICFVISPLGDADSDIRRRSDQVFQYIIAPAAEANGLRAIRSDELSSPGMITNQVIQHILNDKILIADLTDRNANVFYELGLRHAFRKPVVQLLIKGQTIPFDVIGHRTVYYDLDLADGTRARKEVEKQIASSLSPNYKVDSPVTQAADIQRLSESTTPENQLIMKTILDQIDGLGRRVADMSVLVCKPEDFRDAIPPIIRDHLEDILRRYADEIDLLKAIRHAGVVGMFKRREAAINAFVPALDEEAVDIMVIGSSLKGLLLKDEYRVVREKLRFKCDRGLCNTRFLLTHPIFADFRAKQESRRPTEIGVEIIKSLDELKNWNQEHCQVKLYLGTPTCFAIKTTRRMLLNPYPYGTTSYDSPCLILEYSPDGGAERPSYFFDEFKARHFGAWDTELSVPITDFDRATKEFTRKLSEYGTQVQNLLSLAH